MMRQLKNRRFAGLVLSLFVLAFLVQPVWATEPKKDAKPLSASEGKKGVLIVGAVTALGAAALVVGGVLSAPVAIPVAAVVATVGYLATKAGLKAIDSISDHKAKQEKALEDALGETTPAQTEGDGTTAAGNPFDGQAIKVGQ